MDDVPSLLCCCTRDPQQQFMDRFQTSPKRCEGDLPGKSATKTTSSSCVLLRRESSISASLVRQSDKSTSSGIIQGVDLKVLHSAVMMSTRGSTVLQQTGTCVAEHL